MHKHCPNCGCILDPPKRVARRKTAARSIALTGRTFPAQRAWYDEAMKAQHGEILWDPKVNADRFGAPGGWTTPDAWLARRLPLEQLRYAIECGDFESPDSFAIIRQRERAEKFPATTPERAIRFSAREMVAA